MQPQGASIAAVFNPTEWPLAADHLIISGQVDGYHIYIRALRNGSLRAEVLDANGKSITSFQSAPLDVRRGGVFLIANWPPPDGVQILEGGRPIPAAGTTSTRVTIGYELDGPNVFAPHQPNAAVACRTWVEKRKMKFTNAPPKTGRRQKTVSEGRQDLSRSVKILRDLGRRIRAGETHFLGTLAGEIRALTYWKNPAAPDPSYMPLLLRMASTADLPLPVFCPSVMDGFLDSLADLPVHGTCLTEAPLLTAPGKVQIRDLQDWLLVPVAKLSPSSASMAAKELIGEVANTLGAAHYDDDTSLTVDMMQGFLTGNINALTQFIGGTAESLADLSEWVLLEIDSRPAAP